MLLQERITKIKQLETQVNVIKKKGGLYINHYLLFYGNINPARKIFL